MSSCGKWCTARSWQRCAFGHALYRHGEEGNSFHIIAQGQVEVDRDGQRVAQLGTGTSVGEMAYLAPSPALRIHSADVIVSELSTTISFTPQLLEQLSLGTRRLFDTAFIRVLVRRLHAAHEALAHPRRILEIRACPASWSNCSGGGAAETPEERT